MKEENLNSRWISNILIVDDIGTNLKLLDDILIPEGYKTRLVPGGELALLAAEKEKPDRILLDIMMPGMDGFEVCRRLKDTPDLADIPVIFISALGDADNIVKAFSVGGVDYINKPFQAEEVKARVRTHLKMHRQSIELQLLNATLELKVAERTHEIRKINENLELKILEIKSAEEEIIKARDEAMKANSAKSEFLSRVSHELRTPMNAILGFAQLLEMSELGPKQKKGISHILTSGKHLLELIDEVRDISDIDSGKHLFLMESVEIKSIVAEILDTIQPLANTNQIVIEPVNMPVNPIFVMSDRKRLKQVLLNLLSNAVKYNRQGGTISVKIETLPKDNEGVVSVRVSVKDTGLGIQSDDIPQLFLPFNRLEAEKTQTAGIGLGLTVVKRIIDAMEGSVGVESIVGEGSVFWVELPALCEIEVPQGE